jgi:hypothetical protein
LIEENLTKYILPIIRGYVEIFKTSLNEKDVIFGMISRIGWKRSGTRFNTRGSDVEGNVANFVETEQIVSCKKKM